MAEEIKPQDRVRQRAYEIWEEEGRPEGREQDHWMRAERELHGDTPGATSPAEVQEDGMLGMAAQAGNSGAPRMGGASELADSPGSAGVGTGRAGGAGTKMRPSKNTKGSRSG